MFLGHQFYLICEGGRDYFCTTHTKEKRTNFSFDFKIKHEESKIFSLWQVTLDRPMHPCLGAANIAITITWVENSKEFWLCTALCGSKATGSEKNLEGLL